MYKINLFVQISSLIDNLNSQTSTHGELDQVAYTYAREKHNYRDNAVSTEFSLVCFSAKEETINANHLVAPETLSDELVTALATTMRNVLHDMSAVPGDVRDAILASNVADRGAGDVNVGTYGILTSVQVGDMTTVVSSTVNSQASQMPTHVSVDLAFGGVTYSVTFYIDLAYFKSNYSNTAIKVIPPYKLTATDTLDVLATGGYNDVATLLAGVDYETRVREIEAHKGTWSPTQIATRKYDWVCPHDADHLIPEQIPSEWTLLIYGNPDSVNQDTVSKAVRDYILDESSVESANHFNLWSKVLPGLYVPVEFYIVPQWDLLANPTSTPASTKPSGTRASSFSLTRAVMLATLFGGGDSSPEDLTDIFWTSYHNVMLLAVGKRGATEISITDRFGDYDPVNTDVSSPLTQGWRSALYGALAAAENGTTVSETQKLNLVERNSHSYISMVYDDTHFLVLTQASFMEGII